MKIKVFGIILMISSVLFASCSEEVSNRIEAKPESHYAKTFEELYLGDLFDFYFKHHHANKTWVRVWVDIYKDGVLEEEPVIELHYGLSPEKVEEGPLGMGLIDTKDGNYIFLYSYGTSIQPLKIDIPDLDGYFTRWQYAIEKKTLELDQTYLLGVYQKAMEDQFYDLQDEKHIEKLIQDSAYVLLLKMKIEEEV